MAPIIEDIVTKAYALIIDVGSAEGYYAVGLARRLPKARVLARDANPKAQALCAALAAANDVAEGEGFDLSSVITKATLFKILVAHSRAVGKAHRV